MRQNQSRLSRTEHVDVKNKVMFYLSVQRFDAAEKLLKATLVDHKENAGLFNLLGLTYHKQSRFQDAIKHFKLALSANPNFLEAALNLISTLCDLSRYEDAKELFQNLNSTMHDQLKIPHLVVGRLANQHAENGRTYAQAGLTHEAIQEYRKALDLFPKLPDVKYELAKLYYEDGMFDKARSELEPLVESHPEMTLALNLLGLVYHKAGRDDLAKFSWQKSSKADPEDLTSRILIRASQTWATS